MENPIILVQKIIKHFDKGGTLTSEFLEENHIDKNDIFTLLEIVGDLYKNSPEVVGTSYQLVENKLVSHDTLRKEHWDKIDQEEIQYGMDELEKKNESDNKF